MPETLALTARNALRDSWWNTRTVRGFFSTVLLLVALVGGLRLLAPVEHALLGAGELTLRPFPSVMQIVGLPHFVIGFLFMVSSGRMANARSRLAIGAFVAIGAALCWLFYLAGGPDAQPRLPLILVALYFLVHAYRDEWTFYSQYGEERSRAARSHLAWVILGLFAATAAVAWTVMAVAGKLESNLRGVMDADDLAGVSRVVLWTAPFSTFSAMAALLFLAAKRRAGLGLHAMFLRDRPLWFVYLAIPIVVTLCSLFDGAFYSLILLHVIGWWVFATAMLAQRGRKATPRTIGPRGWMRSTQAGFQTLHGVLALVFLVLLVVYFHNRGTLGGTAFAWFLEPDAFYYWTVMHVTVSLVPKS